MNYDCQILSPRTVTRTESFTLLNSQGSETNKRLRAAVKLGWDLAKSVDHDTGQDNCQIILFVARGNSSHSEQNYFLRAFGFSQELLSFIPSFKNRKVKKKKWLACISLTKTIWSINLLFQKVHTHFFHRFNLILVCCI